MMIPTIIAEPVGTDRDQAASTRRRAWRAIDRDTWCRSCGYNLRGLSRRGKCPECAHPVAKSLEVQSFLEHAPVTGGAGRHALIGGAAAIVAGTPISELLLFACSEGAVGLAFVAEYATGWALLTWISFMATLVVAGEKRPTRLAWFLVPGTLIVSLGALIAHIVALPAIAVAAVSAAGA
jgi:hypothetical protein